MKLRLLTCLFATFVAGSALAADAPGFGSNDSFAVSSPTRWTGPYLGASIGYGFGGGFGTNPAIDSPSGGVFGLQGGYDYQYRNFVFGGAADLSINTIDKTNAGVPISGSQNWVGTMRARAGFLPQDNLLVYGTLGFAFGGIRVEQQGLADNKVLTGYTLGFGGEYMFSRNWGALIEYRYTDFGRQTYTIGAPATATQVGNTGHTIRTGINYRF